MEPTRRRPAPAAAADPSPRKHVVATTDGSCDTRSGDGGWAYRLAYRGATGREHVRTASGFEPGTTNNRMELTAAVRALEALQEPCEVTLVTDSQYLKRAFTDGWLATWQRNGWQTADKKSVKNQDLWLRLLELGERHTVRWTWTKGHAGHAHNEEVDGLALQARRDRRGLERG
jgi:ribonuclease HI